jgi:hypothetical protein
MEAEKVDVGKVAFDGRGKVVFVDLIKDKV